MPVKDNDQWKEERRERCRKAKQDIIGTLFYTDIISDMRYFDYQCGNGHDNSFEEFERLLKENLKDPAAISELLDLASDYGADKELSGFRHGFAVAMMIVTQGMAGKPIA